MRRSLLYIGGSELQLPGIRWAREAGLDVVLTDVREDVPGRTLCNRFRSINGADEEALLRFACEVAEAAPLGGAYCSNDFGLGSVARVGRATRTPANEPGAVARALDKYAAGLIWHAAGVPTPLTEAVDTEAELVDALARTGLPAVVKPVGSSGSRGVRTIQRVEEAAEALRAAKAPNPLGLVIVQDRVQGRHVDVNAFFAADAFHPGGILDRYFSDPPHCVPTWGAQPSVIGAELEAQVYELVERAARALGLDVGPVKADVVVTDQGPVVLEVAPRFHGDVSTAHVTPLAADRSPIQDWFGYLADPDAWSPPAPLEAQRHAGWAAILPPGTGTLADVRGLEAALEVPGVRGATLIRSSGARIERLGDNTAVCGFLWAVGGSREELERSLHQARERIEVIIE